MTHPDFSIESTFGRGAVIVGVDEAGLGPWAGPLVVCACLVKDLKMPDILNTQINDSKKINKAKREELFDIIQAQDSIKTAVSIIESTIIDEIGLSLAWQRAIITSVKKLNIQSGICLIDGKRSVVIDGFSVYPVVKGDQKSLSIATASIIAKVTRDRIMQEIHKECPEYGFVSHVGYGTQKHVEALRKFGVSKYHRKSFAPIEKLLLTKLL
jgi:ribonuclease HII